MPANSLKEKLIRLIQLTGPISIAEYFHLCMADPEFGYYKKRQAIGAKADFITSPEISQMFGELIGVWAAQVWQNLESPSHVALVELGPGKGTLMSDLLRAVKASPEFYSAITLYLVETSGIMREQQKQSLAQFEKNIVWLDDISQLPEMPTIILANEFLDVVPIRQFVKSTTKDGELLWREKGIALNDKEQITPILLASSVDEKLLPKGAEKEPEGSVFETSPAREAIAQQIGEHIKAHKGAALFIDYGHAKSGFGDTFQAVSAHKMVDPFESPGMVDLTSHVDFERIAIASKLSGVNVSNIITQGNFLLSLGLLERAGTLGEKADKKTQSSIQDAVERLAGPNQMGDLFKAIALYSGEKKPPAF